jgi:hypothetical protein
MKRENGISTEQHQLKRRACSTRGRIGSDGGQTLLATPSDRSLQIFQEPRFLVQCSAMRTGRLASPPCSPRATVLTQNLRFVSSQSNRHQRGSQAKKKSQALLQALMNLSIFLELRNTKWHVEFLQRNPPALPIGAIAEFELQPADKFPQSVMEILCQHIADTML